MSDWYVWTDDEDRKFAQATSQPDFLLNWKEDYLLHDGVPVSQVIPPDRVIELDKTSGTVIPDSIPNSLLLLLVSDELRGCLEKHSGAQIEFVPFTLQNQRGRKMKEPYFIANVLGRVDCMDRKKSDVDWSAIEPDSADLIRRLVLVPSQLPRKARLLRVGNVDGVFLVREDLAQELLRGPSYGAFFQDLDDYGSEWR